MRIGSRVLAYGLLMAWAPLLLIGTFVIFTIGPRLETHVAERAAASARAKASVVNQLLLGVENHLHATALTSSEQLSSGNQATQESLLNNLIKLNPLLEEVYLLNDRGTPQAWVSRWQVTKQMIPAPVSINPDIQGSFVASVHREPDGRLTAMVCVPIHTIGWQETIGYLAGKVRLRGVADLALASSNTDDGIVFIVNQTGELVGHQDFSQVLSGVNVRSSQAVQDFMSGSILSPDGPQLPPAIRYSNYNGIDVLGTYAPVGNWGWAVVVEQERAKALQPVTQWVLRFHLVGIFLSLSAIGISYVISQRITEPIRQLEQGVNKIARGEWDQDLPGAGNDEIGQLVTAFNHMLTEQREKKELEQRLVLTEKMAALGTVATSVAHEINNPLAIISGYSEDLLDRLREEPNVLHADGEKYLTIICQQTKRCKTILQALLNTARLPLRAREPVDIREAVTIVRELLLYRAQKKGITLCPPELEPSKNSNPIVSATAGGLQQILLNLIINAIDACDEGDTITIQIIASTNTCTLSVTDTGIGISAANLQRLGQSFFTTKPLGQGTGLGIYVIKELIEPWGGHLVIVSPGEGLGTTATLQLPLYTPGGQS